MTEHKKRVHWLLYPFWLIWRAVVWIIEATGRLIGAILGLVLLIAGLFTLSVLNGSGTAMQDYYRIMRPPMIR